MNISDEEYQAVLKALKLAAEYFISRDQMNSRIHREDTRLSPITLLIRDALNIVIVPLQKRIAELEREKQMYINSTDRLTARVKELEVELRDVRKALEGK